MLGMGSENSAVIATINACAMTRRTVNTMRDVLDAIRTARWRICYHLVTVVCMCVVANPIPAQPNREYVSLNEQLVLACYQLNIDAVVKTLRAGASVNARFDRSPFDFDEFRDRWTGDRGHFATSDWSPLMALAASLKLPQPDDALGDVWRDEPRASKLMSAIPADEIQARTARMITIGHILLSHGCQIDAEDCRGATPLYYAADDGKVDLVRFLLSHGSNPNCRVGVYFDGPDQTTPLHVACNSEETTKVLLEYGADPSAKDSDGKTPSDWVELVKEANPKLKRGEDN